MLIDWLNKLQKGEEISWASSRRIRLLRLLGPEALPIGRDLSIVSTSVRENSILFSSLVTAVGSIWGRIGYWLFRLLWLWKKLFKILAFSFSSELIQPSFSRGGIDVLDCGEMKVLRTVHQSLAESSPLVSFEAVLSWKAFLASRISETVLFLKVLNCV